jgi:hypothetical protein
LQYADILASFAFSGNQRASLRRTDRHVFLPIVRKEIKGCPMNRIGRRTVYAKLVIVVLLVIWQTLGAR